MAEKTLMGFGTEICLLCSKLPCINVMAWATMRARTYSTCGTMVGSCGYLPSTFVLLVTTGSTARVNVKTPRRPLCNNNADFATARELAGVAAPAMLSAPRSVSRRGSLEAVAIGGMTRHARDRMGCTRRKGTRAHARLGCMRTDSMYASVDRSDFDLGAFNRNFPVRHAIARRVAPQSHNEERQARMEQLLHLSEDGRRRNSLPQHRINQKLAEKVEDMLVVAQRPVVPWHTLDCKNIF